jgi:crotonobetainyl-CoA:carnitine CoA-transferase CaiB-like acyl-CoA transferase
VLQSDRRPVLEATQLSAGPEATASRGTGAQVLAGVRVVELSNGLPGAQAGQFLADFGADVVQIEPPGGCGLRTHPGWPFWGRGKRAIQLDLGDPGDRAVARQMAVGADVVIETFRPGVADRLCLCYDALAAENPGLVYASITGFGSHGPLAGQIATIAQDP